MRRFIAINGEDEAPFHQSVHLNDDRPIGNGGWDSSTPRERRGASFRVGLRGSATWPCVPRRIHMGPRE